MAESRLALSTGRRAYDIPPMLRARLSVVEWVPQVTRTSQKVDRKAMSS
jgi:hypothetical protein